MNSGTIRDDDNAASRDAGAREPGGGFETGSNLSARLQAQACPGQIVISRPTREALGGQARTEPLGPLTLKGKRDPVQAFELVSLLS